jgi:site-specific DNA recombinase
MASLRAVAYLRVSTAGQAERGMGLEAQRTRVREYAAGQGLELVDVVREAASGAVRDGDEGLEQRPVLQALLERGRAGDFEVLLVARYDRLARDARLFLNIAEALHRAGVTLLSADEQNGDGAVGRFMRGQHALIAQLERDTILERVRRGKDEGRRAGRFVHGAAPFGYRIAPAGGKGKRLEPELALAPIVERIYRDGRRGLTPGWIARALNAEGIAGPTRGKPWNRTTVRNVIENRAYRGELYGVADAHPAIISARLWRDANRALRARSRH